MQIVDMQLRYVKRDIDVVRTPYIEAGRTITVLQWRKKVKLADGSFCIAFHSDGTTTDLGYEWTDWQDVRTEEE